MAKLIDKLYNRLIEGKLVLEDGDDVSAKVKSEIKVGYYALNEDTTKYEYIGEEIPESFSGHVIGFFDDGFYLDVYENGQATSDVFIALSGDINLNNSGNSANFTALNGADKIDFVAITHSFNELDDTLKTIVETALSTGNEQSCTPAQWNVIKALLDKSLYINYDGMSLIKSATDGISTYVFGTHVIGQVYVSVYRIELSYNSSTQMLSGYLSVSN